MPTYQYACTSCGHSLEARQAFRDDPLTTCPECAGRLRKVFGAVGVVFKGSGFYRTDSRAAASAAAENGTGSQEPAKTGNETGGGKDGKPKQSGAAATKAASSPAKDSAD